MGGYNWSNGPRWSSSTCATLTGDPGTGCDRWLAGYRPEPKQSRVSQQPRDDGLQRHQRQLWTSLTVRAMDARGRHCGRPGNGSGMYGVAPGATLGLPSRYSGGNLAPASAVTADLDYATAHGAAGRSIWAGRHQPGTGDTGLRRVAATNNTVVVIAAGNDSAGSPNWPSRYARKPGPMAPSSPLGSQQQPKLADSQPNRAARLGPFYLVAPGVDIISSCRRQCGLLDGHFHGRPAVTGAAALLTGYWPYLRANQVAAILLNTTDDLGAPGMDAIYGRGMLNHEPCAGCYRQLHLPHSERHRHPHQRQTAGVRTTSRVHPSAFWGWSPGVDDYGPPHQQRRGLAVGSECHDHRQRAGPYRPPVGHLETVLKMAAPDAPELAQRQRTSAGQPQRQRIRVPLPGIMAPSPLRGLVSYPRGGQTRSAGDGGLSTLASAWRINSWGNALDEPWIAGQPLANFA